MAVIHAALEAPFPDRPSEVGVSSNSSQQAGVDLKDNSSWLG